MSGAERRPHVLPVVRPVRAAAPTPPISDPAQLASLYFGASTSASPTVTPSPTPLRSPLLLPPPSRLLGSPRPPRVVGVIRSSRSASVDDLFEMPPSTAAERPPPPPPPPLLPPPPPPVGTMAERKGSGSRVRERTPTTAPSRRGSGRRVRSVRGDSSSSHPDGPLQSMTFIPNVAQPDDADRELAPHLPSTFDSTTLPSSTVHLSEQRVTDDTGEGGDEGGAPASSRRSFWTSSAHPSIQALAPDADTAAASSAPKRQRISASATNLSDDASEESSSSSATTRATFVIHAMEGKEARDAANREAMPPPPPSFRPSRHRIWSSDNLARASSVTSHIYSGFSTELAKPLQSEEESEASFKPFSRKDAGLRPHTEKEIDEKERWKIERKRLDDEEERSTELFEEDEVYQKKPVDQKLMALILLPIAACESEALDLLIQKWLHVFELEGELTPRYTKLGDVIFGKCQTDTETMTQLRKLCNSVGEIRDRMKELNMIGSATSAVATTTTLSGQSTSSSSAPLSFRTKYDGAPPAATPRQVMTMREDRLTRIFGHLFKLYLQRYVMNRSAMHLSNLDLLKAQLDELSKISAMDPGAVAPSTDAARRGKEKVSEFYELLTLTLGKIRQNHLVRINGRIKQPIYHHGRFTRAYGDYGKDGEIEDFIERCAYPQAENVRYHQLLNDGNRADMLAKRLLKSQNEHFEENIPERNWHSFWYGIYDVAHNDFMHQDSIRFKQLPMTKVPCHHHDTHFDYLEYRWYVRDEATNPLAFMDIPTPVHQICELQRWPADERVWQFAEGGALLFSKKVATHPLKKFVSTQIGPGGLGKTTLLQMYSNFYHPLDIAQFKTNDEEVFGYERLPEAYIWMGYDIGRNWKIEHTFLFTLIDGGWIKINRKFKKNILYYVEQMGMLAMNEWLNLPNTGGAWARRNLVHRWNYPPPNTTDSSLDQQGVVHIGAIMFVSVSSLRYLSNELGKIDEVTKKPRGVCRATLPPSMWENLKQMQIDTTPLLAFFVRSGKVVAHPDYYVTFTEFNTEYMTWYRGQPGSNRTPPTINAASCQNVFAEQRCSMVDTARPNLEDMSRIDDGSYMLGVTLRKHETACQQLVLDEVYRSEVNDLLVKTYGKGLPTPAYPGKPWPVSSLRQALGATDIEAGGGEVNDTAGAVASDSIAPPPSSAATTATTRDTPLPSSSSSSSTAAAGVPAAASASASSTSSSAPRSYRNPPPMGPPTAYGSAMQHPVRRPPTPATTAAALPISVAPRGVDTTDRKHSTTTPSRPSAYPTPDESPAEPEANAEATAIEATEATKATETTEATEEATDATQLADHQSLDRQLSYAPSLGASNRLVGVLPRSAATTAVATARADAAPKKTSSSSSFWTTNTNAAQKGPTPLRQSRRMAMATPSTFRMQRS